LIGDEVEVVFNKGDKITFGEITPQNKNTDGSYEK
jgi:hypothetical protein